MRLKARLLVIVLSALALFILPSSPRRVTAQWPASQCIKSFYSEWQNPCANCCNNAGLDIDAIASVGDGSPGYQSAYLSTYDCGGGSGCSGYNCGTGEYYEAMDDPTCCSTSSMSCSFDSNCCTGYVCDLSWNQCTSCVPSGDNAYYQSDCCSGTGSYDLGMYWCE